MEIEYKKIIEILNEQSINFQIGGNEANTLKYYTLASLKNIISNGLYYIEKEYLEAENRIENSLILTNATADNLICSSKNVFLLVDNPQEVFYKLCRMVMPARKMGVHPTAIVDANALIDEDVYIGPYSVIGNCKIEKSCYIDAHVVVGDNVIIKKGTTIEPNSYIGAHGVAWVWDERGNRVIQPQFGGVIVEEECFIGSDVSIVRGSVNEYTIIGKGTLIAHGSKIGHGCNLGRDCHLANNVSLAGNACVGDRTFLGAASVLSSHVSIANDCVVAAGAVVVKSFTVPNILISGVPAKYKKEINYEQKLNGVPKNLTKK